MKHVPEFQGFRKNPGLTAARIKLLLKYEKNFSREARIFQTIGMLELRYLDEFPIYTNYSSRTELVQKTVWDSILGSNDASHRMIGVRLIQKFAARKKLYAKSIPFVFLQRLLDEGKSSMYPEMVQLFRLMTIHGYLGELPQETRNLLNRFIVLDRGKDLGPNDPFHRKSAQDLDCVIRTI
jgi:hypothetical protein